MKLELENRTKVDLRYFLNGKLEHKDVDLFK